MGPLLLPGIIRLFEYYRLLAEKAIAQLTDAQLFMQQGGENSIALIVQHLSGNMKSRFTDFLTTDGEKPWRNRDAEFEPQLDTRQQLLAAWEEGWQILFHTLQSLGEDDLSRTVYIRNEGHTVADAVLRQLAHYSYHIGQIVHSGKQLLGDAWQPLSILRGDSEAYNQERFSQPKANRHFTENP